MCAQWRDETGNAINSFSVYLHFVSFFLVVGLLSKKNSQNATPAEQNARTFFNQTGPMALKQGIFGVLSINLSLPN
jgi:hypothetical protein